jgi:hypothetical protein
MQTGFAQERVVETSLLLKEKGKIDAHGGRMPVLKRTTKYRLAEFQSSLGAILKKSGVEPTRTVTICASAAGLDYGRVHYVATGKLLKHTPSTPQTYFLLPLSQPPVQSLQSLTAITVFGAQLPCFVCKH